MYNAKLLIVLAALAVIMACIPTAARPAIPTSDPGLINTLIVQTANAASTGTAFALPTFTATATFTRTPRATETASPTATQSFVFILPGSTSVIPSTTALSAGTTSSAYACKIISVEPALGTAFAPRTDFIATWAVKNIGKTDWFRASMNYTYVSGDKLHKVTSYQIPKGAEIGKNVILTADMEAPKETGVFTTTWGLVVEDHYFCPLTLKIVVQ